MKTFVRLLPLLAIPGTTLAAHAEDINIAVRRAIEVREGDVKLPGNWTTGVMLPRKDGKMNYSNETLPPTSGPRLMWIGSNGG